MLLLGQKLTMNRATTINNRLHPVQWYRRTNETTPPAIETEDIEDIDDEEEDF